MCDVPFSYICAELTPPPSARIPTPQGNYTQWLEHKQKRLDTERAKEAAQARALQSELEWIRGRAGQASKARAKGVEARRKEQRGMAERLQQLEGGRIMIPPGPRLGERVLWAAGLRKAYEGRVLFENVNLELVRSVSLCLVLWLDLCVRERRKS